jgi:hypothetical protein
MNGIVLGSLPDCAFRTCCCIRADPVSRYEVGLFPLVVLLMLRMGGFESWLLQMEGPVQWSRHNRALLTYK